MRCATYNALQEIEHERLRQESDEGWTPEHDDSHEGGDLAHAAAAYAMGKMAIVNIGGERTRLWPWEDAYWKDGDTRRRQLVKAGALIVAELERLERASTLTRPVVDSDINGPSGIATPPQEQPNAHPAR